MSRGERLIQIAIISDDKEIADTLQAFSTAYCVTKGKRCRCTVFPGLEAFAAALYPEMFAVVFSSCVSGEGALVKLRNERERLSNYETPFRMQAYFWFREMFPPP